MTLRRAPMNQASLEKRLFQHRVMVGGSSAEADRIGSVIGRGDRKWSISPAWMSRWRKRRFASWDETALSSTRRRCRLRRRISRPSLRGFQPADASYSRPAEWRRCSTMVCANSVPVICIESRQAYQALKLLATHKTDRNDARGLAHLARTGFFKPVYVKSLSAHAVRSLIIARKKLVGHRVTLENQIRGLAVVFGVRLPRALSPAFIQQALQASDGIPGLLAAIVAIDADIRRLVRASDACRRLMSIPGVGQLTTFAFTAAVDDPRRFRRSRDIGPYLGLVPRRYQSGEIDYTGSISKCGDRRIRTLLYEAANVMLTRYKGPLKLKEWAFAIAKRSTMRKAKVALARRLAIIMHSMLRHGTEFEPA